LKNLKLFFWALIIQIFILNNIQLSGYINPYYYIVFILYFPTKSTKTTILLLSFTIGFIMDIFCYSYGTHAFASVLIAYLKILWASKLNYNKDSDELFEMKNLSMNQFIIVSIYFIFIHHFTLFFLESFSFRELFVVIQTTLASSTLTLILVVIHKFLTNK